MIEYLIVCVRLLFIISVNGKLDITLYIKNYGSVVCPFTNFCHTKATKTLRNDTLMPCCLPCSCEANCWKVGNCCPDRNTTDFELPELKCIDAMVKHRAYDNFPYVGYTDGIQRYRVKDSCLATENNEKVIKLCEEEEKKTVEEYTWVSEISSGRIFKNRYCALCNNVSDFEEWQIRTRFSPALLTNYSHLSKSIFSDDCDLIAEIPKTQRKLASMYRCLIPRFSKCNESGLWSHFDMAIVRACETYDSPIFIPNVAHIITYKNIYCYICNVEVISIDSTVCANWEIKGKSIGQDFSALIDFKKFQQDEEGTPDMKCPVEEVYDPFMNECRNLKCPFGSTAYYGKCENIAQEIIGLRVQIHYNIQVLQSQSRICQNDSEQLDKEALAKGIENKFMKLLGLRKGVCTMCSFQLRIVENKHQSVPTEFILSTVISSGVDCQLDLLFDVITSVFGKTMKIVLSDCLNLKMIYRLEKRPQQFIVHQLPISDWNMLCSAMLLLDTEKICPEVKISASDLLSRLEEKPQAKIHALFRPEDDFDNDTLTVCWKDYMSVMSQIYPPSASSALMSPDQIRETILPLTVYPMIKFSEYLYVKI